MVSKKELRIEVLMLAEEIHVKPQQIRIRAMKSKIGSCSPGKILTFNSSVLDLDYSSRKEVIVHELLHLRYRNHGKVFKIMLQSYMAGKK